MHIKSPAAATDVAEFITDFAGGELEQMLSVAVSTTAAAVVDRAQDKKAKKGKVNVTFEFEAIPGTQQVRIAHTVKFTAPTLSGKKSEESEGATVMHVGKGGKLTLTQATLNFEDGQQRIPGG